MALLEAKEVTKRFGGLVANDRVSMTVEEGQIIGLIGPNGAGKSTFFNVLAGYYSPDGGEVHFGGHDVTGRPPEAACQLGIARTFQVVKPFSGMTVLENVMVGAFLRYHGVHDARRKAREVVDFVGLGGKADWPASALTIANKKRLELARALASEPRLLLLDEVMAGLTPTETHEAVELVRRVHAQGITMVVVEHVMEVVMPISHHIVVLDQGRKIAEGTPDEVARDPEVIRSYLGEVEL